MDVVPSALAELRPPHHPSRSNPHFDAAMIRRRFVDSGSPGLACWLAPSCGRPFQHFPHIQHQQLQEFPAVVCSKFRPVVVGGWR